MPDRGLGGWGGIGRVCKTGVPSGAWLDLLAAGELPIPVLDPAPTPTRRMLRVCCVSTCRADMLPCVLEVRVDNGRAQQLYGKLGFQVAGRRKKYNADGTDSLVMLRQPGPLA